MSISEHLKKSMDRHKAKTAPRETKSKKSDRVEIHKAENGFTVKSSQENDDSRIGGYVPPQEHVFGHKDHKKMLKHVADCLGCEKSEESGEMK